MCQTNLTNNLRKIQVRLVPICRFLINLTVFLGLLYQFQGQLALALSSDSPPNRPARQTPAGSDLDQEGTAQNENAAKDSDKKENKDENTDPKETKSKKNNKDSTEETKSETVDKDSSDESKSTNNSKTGQKKTGPYSFEAVKHYNRAVELHKAGFLSQAIEEYKLAINADDRLEEAYSNLGILYVSQHNYDKAILAFQKALELKPNRPTTLNGLATTLYANGKLDEAKKRWLEVIKISPKFSSAYYNLGNVFDNEKNYLQAENYYLRAIDVNPKMTDAYYRLGNLLLKLKYIPQAKLFYVKANEINPTSELSKDIQRKINAIDLAVQKVKKEHRRLSHNIKEKDN